MSAWRRRRVHAVESTLAFPDSGDIEHDLTAHYSGPRRELAVKAMQRAQSRGQLRQDIDPEVVVDQLWGACYHRLFLPDLPVTEDFAVSLVDNIPRGIRADPGR